MHRTYMLLPFYLNKDSQYFHRELEMARDCLKSLERCDDIVLIIYNQGCYNNNELTKFLNQFSLEYRVLGSGDNIGIVKARYRMMEYIYATYPSAKYVGEIHLDMVFTPNFHIPLIEYLKETDEPLVAPRVLYFDDEKQYYRFCDEDKSIEYPKMLVEKIRFLKENVKEGIVEAFYHPVIHQIKYLKQVHPYDVRFLEGAQGYEDDSILLGYSMQIGLKKKWKPKCYMASCVYHQRVGQRLKLPDVHDELSKNLKGLLQQYGAYGMEELARIYNSPIFYDLYNRMIFDMQAEQRETEALWESVRKSEN